MTTLAWLARVGGVTMRDMQLAKVPTRGPISEVIAGVAFLGILLATPDRDVFTWLGIAAAVVSIASAVRSTRMEVRLLDQILRVVNFWSTIDVPLHDIESVMPDQAIPDRLSLLVADVDKPIDILVSPRSGKRLEALRRQRRSSSSSSSARSTTSCGGSSPLN
ncbi:MAG: hypothetical protein GY788_03925 [bacterium]|nr:hypothetical protein [bacterium]